MLLSEEDLARIFKQRIDEDEAASGERSPLRDQPVGSLPISTPNVLDEVPGFTKQGDPDAPYYVPTEETKKTFVPTADNQQAPSSLDDAPPTLAPQTPDDPEAALRALIPDAFERAAQTTRRFKSETGREEGGATGFIEKAVPTLYRALDKLAQDATEQSRIAAEGDPAYSAKPILDAAQAALPGKGALLVGGGLLAGELGAQKGRPLSGTPAELAELLVPSAEAKTDQEKLIEAARKRLGPGEAPPDAAEQLKALGQQRVEGDVPVDTKMPQKPQPPKPPTQRSKEKPGAFEQRQAEYAKRVEEYPAKLAEYEAAKKKFHSTYTPTAQRIIGSVGGPKVVKDADYTGIGTIAAISAGMILAPRVFRAFKAQTIAPPMSIRSVMTLQPGVFRGAKNVTGRPVEDAMPGTQAFSSPIGLARSADDINRTVLRVGESVGIVPAVQERLENTFAIYSRSNARHLVESAVETGRMETPAFRFHAPVSLADMQRTFTPEMRQYIVALDTLESLVERSRLPQFRQGPRNPNPGLPTIGGQNFQQVAQIVRAMEQANPEVREAARAWEGWNRARRNFEVNGEYATIQRNNPNANPALPDRSQQYNNAQHRFEVPWLGREQDRSLDIADRIRRQDPIQMQSRYSKQALRARLENEAIGQFVDAMRQARPASFVRVGNTPEEAAQILADAPRYRKNTVSFYRRGVRETYTTDPTLADALKMDPDTVTNGAAQLIYGTKRMIEFGATGLGAPFFAPTSMLRNWQIAKYTADEGYRSPGLLGSMRAVPQQLYPMLARGIARSFETGQLSRFAGQGWADSLAQTMAAHYDHSLYAQLQRVGSSRGSILEHERINTGLDAMTQAIKEYAGPARPWLNSYKNMLEAIHNGPAFEYVRKNLSVDTLPQVASRARALTGNPRTTGQYYFKDEKGISRPIRYERGGSVSHTLGEMAVRPYMWLNENVGRTATPWFNATQQGIKRIGEAYLDNPAKFVRNMWLYAGMPAAANYLYTHSLGKDPNGQSYVDYMMNRRSAYNTQMNWYVPLPWLPAERGLEVPHFHELAPARRLMEVGMDHMFGNADNALRDDYWKAAHAFVDTAITPPLPPVIGGVMSLYGMQPPMGAFGGEVYQIKTDPFDQLGGLPANIESFARTLGGGIGTAIGSGYAAFTQTPEGFHNRIMNAGSEVGQQLTSRAPMIRDITGILPPMTGNTDIRKELFEKQREIDQLLKYYQKWDKNAGQINVKPASPGGGQAADTGYGLGPTIPAESPGLSQPPPTNPLYIKFMGDVYNRFKRESPNYVKGEDQGGIGFRSLWRRYGDSTEALKSLRPINEGNYVTWQNELNNKPEVKKWLEDQGVNTKNLREVKNVFVKEQQDAARVILKTIRAVEEDFSKMAGRPIKLKDLNPYADRRPLEEAPFFAPDVVEDVAKRWNTPAAAGP